MRLISKSSELVFNPEKSFIFQSSQVKSSDLICRVRTENDAKDELERTHQMVLIIYQVQRVDNCMPNLI